MKMLFFANKHPGIVVLVCLINYLYTFNCKLNFTLMADVIAILILADVMPKVVADVIATEVC